MLACVPLERRKRARVVGAAAAVGIVRSERGGARRAAGAGALVRLPAEAPASPTTATSLGYNKIEEMHRFREQRRDYWRWLTESTRRNRRRWKTRNRIQRWFTQVTVVRMFIVTNVQDKLFIYRFTHVLPRYRLFIAGSQELEHNIFVECVLGESSTFVLINANN